MNVFPKKILGVNIMEYKVYNTPHAYVLLRVEPGTIERLFSKFKTLNFIEWGGLLTGPYDIALRVWAKDSKEFYNHINKLKSFEGVIDIRTDFIHSELPEFNGFHKPVSGLLKVYVKGGIEPDAFMHKLENLDGLVNISWIAGDTDFLIGLEANSTKDLTTNILKNLLSIKDIRRTETYILGDSFLLKR
jgi:DNA-binding Lrp family transcriptional regulator